jgi:hypothetical protein
VAWIRFATQNAALLDLMYLVKRGPHSAALDDAFGRLFTTFGDLAALFTRPGRPETVGG